MATCTFCDRSFGSTLAVQNHQRDSKKCAELRRQIPANATASQRDSVPALPSFPAKQTQDVKGNQTKKTAQQQELCAFPECTRPVWIGEGIAHKYCGRTHARAALLQQGEDLAAPHGNCHICRLPGCDEPVLFESNGRVHEFCSKSHAEEADQRGLCRPSRPAIDPSGPAAGVPPLSARECSFPRCFRPRFWDERGFYHDFCGRSHAIQAKGMGIEAVSTELAGKVSRVWRGREGQYTLSVLTRRHDKFADVVKQFEESWKHPGQVPTVTRVLQVRNSEEVYGRYIQYKKWLEENSDGGAGEVRRFHGTSMAPTCSFAINDKQPPCADLLCAVCSICASSFDLRHCGTGPNAGTPVGAMLPSAGLRYGRGLYFSRVSSKSDTYAGMSERRVRGELCRVMFLCKVAVGDAHETAESQLTEDQVDQLVSARHYGGMYDAIVGKGHEDGGPLNYQETVVYDNRAAMPSYLIVYEL